MGLVNERVSHSYAEIVDGSFETSYSVLVLNLTALKSSIAKMRSVDVIFANESICDCEPLLEPHAATNETSVRK